MAAGEQRHALLGSSSLPTADPQNLLQRMHQLAWVGWLQARSCCAAADQQPGRTLLA